MKNNYLINKLQGEILANDLDVSVIWLFIEKLYNLNKTEFLLSDIEVNEAKLSEMVKRYISGVHPQYITNQAYFYKRNFYVDNRVLIPRFETEELVINAIELIKKNKIKTVCDLGCGSGIIGISIALETSAVVTCVDISNDALEVSKYNAKMLNANLNFSNSSMLNEIDDIEMIVSNPPYIKEDGFVNSRVLNQEPHLALFGGKDGLVYYREILENCYKLKSLKYILFELSDEIADDLKLLIEYYFKCNIKIISDINNQRRIIIVNIKEPICQK